VTIKQSPADFLVEEVLADAVARKVHDAPAPHALYRLAKENLTTPDAAAAAARSLGVRPGAVACAGLKDRHARTVQHVTVKRAASGALAESAEGPGWRVERIGWLDEPLTAEAIAANRFRITVRDLAPAACARMDEAVRLLTPADNQDHPALPVGARKPSTSVPSLFSPSSLPSSLCPSVPPCLLFVNYFGDQRFGSARHGQGFLARHLIRGEFEEALRLAIAVWARKDSRRQKAFKRAVAEGWGQWPELAEKLPRCPERRAVEHLAASPADFRGAFAALPYGFQELAVHAYQSHLWNAAARRLVTERCTGPAITARDPFGEMIFPAAAGIPKELRDLEVPLLGRGSAFREPWGPAAEAALAEEGIATEMLHIPGLRRPQFGEVPRRLFVSAESFSLASPVPDRGPERLCRTVAFDLPRGAYATVVLRALGQ
jgi:tRNA pseudouridine13 synthase